jgi:hypothetical protein
MKRLVNMRKMVNGLFYVPIFFFCVTHSTAQDNSGCLSKHQLFKMQSSSLDDIRLFLNDENWSFDGAKSNQTYNYFDYPINYNIVSWAKSSYSNGDNIILYTFPGKPNIVAYQSSYSCFNELLKGFISTKGKTSVDEDKLVTTFKENSITIEFREYKNDYSSRKFSILVYNSTALFQEIKNLKEIDDALKKAEVEIKNKYDSLIKEAEYHSSVGEFEIAKSKYLDAQEIENNTSLQSKIDLCNNSIYQKLIDEGDSLYTENKYELALSIYMKARNYTESLIVLENKILLTKNKILDNKIKTIQIQADVNFNDKKYESALANYNSVLDLDKSNEYAIEKIKQIKIILNILEKRSTTIFSYKATNTNELSRFKNLILEDVNYQVNRHKEGFIDLSYLISFDTLGNNLSTIKNISTSLKGDIASLSNIDKKGILKPSSESGYFLASQENLNLNLKWSTTKNLFKSKSKGIFPDFYRDQNSVESFINKQPIKYGNYFVETKNKEINGDLYTSINLVKYRTIGPSAALYSMLMPGLGSLKVSYGNKGWGRFTSFLLSSGLAIGSKLFSDSQYKSYLGATNQADIDNYYDKANISHKIAISSIGLATTIYLYDIIWVLSKGAKNIKDSRPLRKQLQQGPVQIQNQSITWQ